MKIAISLNFKKILKNTLLVAIPLSVVGACTWAYIANNKKPVVPNEEIEDEGLTKRQVYTISKDNLVVPLTVGFEPKEELINEITFLSSLLNNDSSLVKGDYVGVLPKNTDLKEVTLEEKILTLNYTETFVNYESNKENRILEAITWTFTQYEEVDSVVLAVEDEVLTHMPVANLPLPSKLNRSIGINNHLFNTGLSNQKTVNIYYQKEINNKATYVPVTVNVTKDTSKGKEIMQGLAKILPVSSVVKKANLLGNNDIIAITDPDENKNVNLNLGVSSLVDEVTVDNKIFDYVVMTLLANQVDLETVSVIINDEVVNVDGYQNTAVAVSGIVYNTFKL